MASKDSNPKSLEVSTRVSAEDKERPYMLNIVQHNMARSRATSDELNVYCLKNKVDIALVNEPYTRQGKLFCLEDGNNRFVKSKINTNHGIWAAIVVFNPEVNVLIKTQLNNEFFEVASVDIPGQESLDVVSGYFQFRKETEIFTDYLRGMRTSLLNSSVIGLDVNATSERWHGRKADKKGKLVEAVINDLDLVIVNKPDKPWTFQGVRGRSNIDVTLVTRELAHKVHKWLSITEETSSNHTVIDFEIRENVKLVNCDLMEQPQFKNKKIKKELGEKVKVWMDRSNCKGRNGSLNKKVELLTGTIVRALKRCYP